MYPWSDDMNCAVTVCDTEGTILYMNEKARQTFARHGDLVGKNMLACHSPASQAKIKELIATGGSNASREASSVAVRSKNRGSGSGTNRAFTVVSTVTM